VRLKTSTLVDLTRERQALMADTGVKPCE
jgi:hypothetical protein